VFLLFAVTLFITNESVSFEEIVTEGMITSFKRREVCAVGRYRHES